VAEQAHRLSEIITELMDFARPLPASVKKTDLSEVVDSALRQAKAMEESADRKIETAIDDAPAVAVDAKQASAAVAAVIENAIQATAPTTGCIQIHAGFDPYSERVVLTVTDNGCGMDDNTLKRVFDPFFSAKPAGRRRGLGLSKALRWIEASGGSIRLESRPGVGTRAVILLPAYAAANAPAPTASNGAAASGGVRGGRSKAS
jgi:signal transduction histidine kinase